MKRSIFLLWMALSGAMFGVVGAFYKELTSGSLLVLFLIGPAIEEILKLSGVFHLLNKHPEKLTSRWQILGLSMLAGAVFATLENLIYLYVYVPQHTASFAMYRFVVCTLLHVSCSGLLGWGVSGQLTRLQQAEEETFFDLDRSYSWVVAAIAVHACYNIGVTLLQVGGVRLY